MTQFNFRLSTLSLLVLLSACGAQPEKDNSQAKSIPEASQVANTPAPMVQELEVREIGLAQKKVEMTRNISAGVAMSDEMMAPGFRPPQFSGEQYEHHSDNDVIAVKDQAVSTFSIDVDTASYSNIRRFINNGQTPPKDAVRIEEMINYFDYDYPSPSSNETPFRVTTEIAPTPWSTNSKLLQIGIKGYLPSQAQNTPKNLVFLLDVSGSMNQANKLPLVKQSLRLLVNQLSEQDSVAIVVYAGSAGVVLSPTSGDKHQEILSALNRLQAGGSTNGAQGILRAYELAEQQFKKGGVNRVLLATDGDFNVGASSTDDLLQLIKNKKRSGVGLTILAMGMGNLNDQMLETISNAGDGNAAYIDTLQEAKKVLVTDINATLQTIAKDTKIQMEFNPELVSHYRLIGYENRVLNQQDFENDKVDAGDIGAGHTVTALYEITLKNASRYQTNEAKSNNNDELGFLKIRYKRPTEDRSIEISEAVHKRDIKSSLNKASKNFRFAAAVAGFGQILRHNKHIGDYHTQDVMDLAQDSTGEDKYGYRNEFVSLVSQYEALIPQQPYKLDSPLLPHEHPEH